MAVEFPMPKLGLTMEEAMITAWLVADGTEVAEGAEIVEIETDKVVSNVEASGSGVLRITGTVGETYACGERIGWFLEAGESPPVDEAPRASPAPAPSTGPDTPNDAPAAVQQRRRDGARLFASPNARRVAALRGIDLSRLTGSGPGGRIVSEDVPEVGLSTDGPGTATPASPAARHLASLLGLDLAEVRAAGPDPRVVRADVARHARERLASADPARAAPAPAPIIEPPLAQTPAAVVPMTGMRGTIAGRMHASLQEMAQLTLTMDVAMDAVVHDRADGGHETKPGYTDYVVVAVAEALREHPLVNSQIHDGRLALLPEVNVGVAIALEGGLVVPVVKAADTLPLEELSRETTRLATAARAGELSRDDIEGGTFSVTALGMYGVDAFTPVINPPNTAILGVGRLRDGVRWDGDVTTRTTLLTLSLTWDHRAFDGAPAAEFTAAVRDRLETWGAAQ